MNWLAGLVMRGRAPAVLVTVVFAVLSIIVQPLVYLSGAAVALVTLRLGAGPGLFVTVAASAVVFVLAGLSVGNPAYALAFVVGVWAPVWVLAIVLRATINLPTTVLTGAGLALAAVLGMHAVFGDPAQFWMQVLDVFLKDADLGGQLTELKEVLARSMTAMLAMAWLFGVYISLLLGRWWQAMLYNPGGFKTEFLGLHIGKWPAWGVVALSLWAMVDKGEMGSLPTDLAVVSLAPFALVGVSLMHAWVEYKERSVWWLLPVYLLALFLLPQVIFSLALLGLSDGWVDWRSRWQGRGSLPSRPAANEDEGRGEALPPGDEGRPRGDEPDERKDKD